MKMLSNLFPPVASRLRLLAIVAALGVTGGTMFGAEDPQAGDLKAAAGDQKSDASKHAPGHATDSSLVFKTVRVVARQLQQDAPLAAASVKVHYYWKSKSYTASYTTDEKGEVDVEVPTNRGLSWVSLESHPKKLVPVYYHWDGGSHDVSPPSEVKLQFEPGTTIGGTVQDESEKPIAKAKVQLHLPATAGDAGPGGPANLVFTLATPTTDADGHWQCDTAPADLQSLSINISHPDFLSGGASGHQQEKALHDSSAVTVLKQGLKVVGRVVDEQVQPIAGALVQLGDRFGSGSPETKSDAEGKFTLKNCKTGDSYVSVIANGFSPEMQDFVIAEQDSTVANSGGAVHEGNQVGDLIVKLKPGNKISGRVVDPAGKPVKAVWIVSDTWRNRRSLKWEVHTDAEGKFESDCAPLDEMQCDVLATGFMSIRHHILQPRQEPYEIVVHPPVTVTGKVIDGETGKPIEKFSLIPGILWNGRTEVYWQRDRAMACAAGKYETRYTEPQPQVALMVEADGYAPSYSDPFTMDEEKRTVDFKLSKASAFGGVVTNADGQAVEGADVVVLCAGNNVNLRDNLLDRRQNRNSPQAVSDKEGHFKLPNQTPPYLVIATHPKQGYAEIFTDQETESFDIPLIPWARIEGKVFIGDKPAAGQSVSFQRLRESSNLQLPLPKLAINNPAAVLQMAQAGGGRAIGRNALVAPGAGPQAIDLQRLVQDTLLNQMRINNFSSVEATTDAEGNFAFEHVVPGRIAVMRQVVLRWDQYSTSLPCSGSQVDVASGETAKVVLGGAGRPVIGHVDVPPVGGKPFAFAPSNYVEINLERVANMPTGEGEYYVHRFAAPVGRDGKFQIDDVPPGNYRLTIRITVPGKDPFGQAVGTVSEAFKVPEFESGEKRMSEPLDLGELKPQLNPQAGAAP